MPGGGSEVHSALRRGNEVERRGIHGSHDNPDRMETLKRCHVMFEISTRELVSLFITSIDPRRAIQALRLRRASQALVTTAVCTDLNDKTVEKNTQMADGRHHVFWRCPAVNLHNSYDYRWISLCGLHVKMKTSPAVSCKSISGGCVQAFRCGSPVAGQTTEALSALCLLSWLCGRSNNRELQPHYL